MHLGSLRRRYYHGADSLRRLEESSDCCTLISTTHKKPFGCHWRDADESNLGPDGFLAIIGFIAPFLPSVHSLDSCGQYPTQVVSQTAQVLLENDRSCSKGGVNGLMEGLTLQFSALGGPISGWSPKRSCKDLTVCNKVE